MLIRFFPFIAWFRELNLPIIRVDFVSGFTVALVLIPQSMANAQLAGLPSYYGLYASFLPPMIAALFGSSRQLSTGPVAVVSLMTATALEPLAAAGTEGFIAYAILLALIVGLFQLLLGLLRLGLVVNFISHPVVNGFTNAAALIIASSQLSKVFGVYVDRGEHQYETVFRVVDAAMSYTHWPSFFIGALAFLIMFGLKRLDPKIPNVLVAVMVTTILSWGFRFERDYEAPISSIRSARAQKLIEGFNTSVNEMRRAAKEATDVSSKLVRGTNPLKANSTEILEIEHLLALKKLQRKASKRRASSYRKRLRSLKFFIVKDNQGSLRFYLQEEVSPSQQNNLRTWRIKVGERPLDKDALLLMGGGAVVGTIPRGLPAFSIPKLDFSIMLELFPYAAIICLLGFMEAISIAKAMAGKTGQRIDPNQELIGQGLANILGALTKSYPVSGSFARSAVNLQAGAVTGLSSVFTSLIVIVFLLFLTPLLYHLPQSVLAAIIMMAVLGLINVSGFVHAWKAQWYDGAVAVITFICTLAFAPRLDRGILIGVGLSISIFLYKSMRPRVAILSRHLDGAYHDARAFGLERCEHIAMVRFDGPLFFANASYLEDQISKIRLSMPKLKHILIDASGIDDMDASGEESLSHIVDRVRSAGFEISFCSAKKNILDVLKRTYLYEKIGPEHFYSTQNIAIESIHKMTHVGTEERECPLTTVCPTCNQAEAPMS